MSEQNTAAASVFETRTYPFGKMPPYPLNARPTHVKLRELDFRIEPDGATLSFFFSGGENIALTNGDREFAALVDRVAHPQYGVRTPPPTMHPDFASPLSLRNDTVSYVLYRLSRARRWQFAQAGFPFSVGDRGKPYAFDAWRVGANFNDKDQGTGTRQGCFVAYFIANGELPTGPTMKHYDFPINLHIDLLYDGDRHIPLIVDPDVRYPGGSGLP